MTRLTPEREKFIRSHAASDFGLTVHQELLAEIDALRADEDEDDDAYIRMEEHAMSCALRAREYKKERDDALARATTEEALKGTFRKHWRKMLEERNAARAEVEKLKHVIKQDMHDDELGSEFVLVGILKDENAKLRKENQFQSEASEAAQRYKKERDIALAEAEKLKGALIKTPAAVKHIHDVLVSWGFIK